MAARAEVTWIEGGFEVHHSSGAEAVAVEYRREEPKEHGPKNFDVDWYRHELSCEVYFSAGVYRIEDVSEGSHMGRPKALTLTRGTDKQYRLRHHDEDDDELAHKKAISGHYGRTIND